MTLPESTVSKVREALAEGIKYPATFAIASHVLALLDAPPPAMGGLPELREVITWWCPNHLKARPEKGRCIHRDRSVEPFECDDAIALVARDGVGGKA